MARSIYLLFGVVAYLIFFATFLYLIGFVGNLPWVPRTVDTGGTIAEPALAAVVDVALIALFGLQHSVMARPGFKAAWTRTIPHPIERSMYVLCASLALILMFVFWQPIPAIVWDIGSRAGATVLWAVFWIGWLTVLVSTFLISHFELFGLSQVWSHARGASMADPVFRQPFFYRFVRHPIYLGFILAFWATPVMTVGHLLLAGGMSFYMLVAIRFEERDLIRVFGVQYQEYRVRVGMLMPRIGRGSP
ncbi:MAG: methanethiol S-methyltransferase [Sphingomonadales bacterium]